jgi:hypothetical protein
MSDYKMNKPIVGNKKTLWYKTLIAIYKANKPLCKKEWLKAANISFSDEKPIFSSTGNSQWSYRHWRGLYPAMFKHFQYLDLVFYSTKDKKWYMNRKNYEKFCKNLCIDKE